MGSGNKGVEKTSAPFTDMPRDLFMKICFPSQKSEISAGSIYWSFEKCKAFLPMEKLGGSEDVMLTWQLWIPHATGYVIVLAKN